MPEYRRCDPNLQQAACGDRLIHFNHTSTPGT
jgi:hypothetical protein